MANDDVNYKSHDPGASSISHRLNAVVVGPRIDPVRVHSVHRVVGVGAGRGGDIVQAFHLWETETCCGRNEQLSHTGHDNKTGGSMGGFG